MMIRKVEIKQEAVDEDGDEFKVEEKKGGGKKKATTTQKKKKN